MARGACSLPATCCCIQSVQKLLPGNQKSSLLKLRNELLKLPNNEETSVFGPVRLVHIVAVVLSEDQSEPPKALGQWRRTMQKKLKNFSP